MQKKLIFILGGARSGKSRYAQELAGGLSKKVLYIATAEAGDKEMARRIKLHRIRRPKTWKTVEAGRDIVSALAAVQGKYSVILIDCLGFLVSNLLMDGLKDGQIESKMKLLLEAVSGSKVVTILVSNEVGGGIVPDNLLSRRFRDLLGTANQKIAQQADRVILMQAGIPIVIKGECPDE